MVFMVLQITEINIDLWNGDVGSVKHLRLSLLGKSNSRSYETRLRLHESYTRVRDYEMK